MKIKTSELIGPALDWAVELIERDGVHHTVAGSDTPVLLGVVHKFSSDPAHGCPISWREGILSGPSPFPAGESAACIGSDWDAGRFIQVGPTPLNAAMRCYVASKLGEEVDVPDELLK